MAGLRLWRKCRRRGYPSGWCKDEACKTVCARALREANMLKDALTKGQEARRRLAERVTEKEG